VSTTSCISSATLLYLLPLSCHDRIRKKARHQELLDNEQRYQEMKTAQDLRNQRTECFRCFLSIRESMLRSSLDEPEAKNQPPAPASNEPKTSPDTTQERGLVTPQRAVKFVKFQMANESFLTDTSSVKKNTAERLGSVVDFDAGFEFSSNGGALDSSSNAAQVSSRKACANC